MRLETTDSSGRQIGERWNEGEKWEKIERKTLTFPFLSSHHGKNGTGCRHVTWGYRKGGVRKKKGRMLGGFRGKCGKSFPFFLPKHSLPRHISSLQMTNYYSNFPLCVCVWEKGKRTKTGVLRWETKKKKKLEGRFYFLCAFIFLCVQRVHFTVHA